MIGRLQTIVVLTLLGAAASHAQSPSLQLTAGFANTVKEQQYSSARVLIVYEGPTKQCRLVVRATDGTTAGSVAEEEVSLGGKTRKRIEVPLFAEAGTDEVVAELHEGSRVLARQSVKVKLVDAQDRLIVALAAGSTGVEETRGEACAVPNIIHNPYGGWRSSPSVSKPHVTTIESWDDLPVLPLGWRTLDALVIVGAPPRTVRDEQKRALERWVRGGGTIIVSPGDDPRAFQASFLAPWLPGRLTGEMKQKSLRSVQLFSGAPQAINGEALVAAGDAPKVSSDSFAIDDSKTGLVTRRGWRHGQVVLLTFNPTREPFARWEGRKAFWSALLRWTLEHRSPWYAGNQYEWRLRELMHQMKVVQVPPRALLLAPILVYGIALIVVGLGVARIAGRREKTWLVLCAMALLFSLGFYGFFRGKVHARATLLGISITDVTPGAKTARTTLIMEAFSPAQRYLDMTVNATHARLQPHEGNSYMPYSTPTRSAMRGFTPTASRLTGDVLQPWNLTQIVARFEASTDHSFELKAEKPALNSQMKNYHFSNRDRQPLRLARLSGSGNAITKMNDVAAGATSTGAVKLSGAWRNIPALSQLPTKKTDSEKRDQVAEWLMDVINQDWRSNDEEMNVPVSVLGLTDRPAPAVTVPGFRQEWYHFIRVIPPSEPGTNTVTRSAYRPPGLGSALWVSRTARTANSNDNTLQIGVGEAVVEVPPIHSSGARFAPPAPAGVPKNEWTVTISGDTAGGANVTYAAYNWKTGKWNEWRPTKGSANATSPSLGKDYFFNEMARLRLTVKGSTKATLSLRSMDWAVKSGS